MSVLEIIAGVLLILCSVTITLLVLSQESKGKGLSAVIGGGMMEETRSRFGNSIMARYTKYAAIGLFVLAIAVNLINVLM